MDFANLRTTGAGWEFATEADLEDFVWANLKQLFGLIPLKRQFYVKGQICDILALRENKQLVVLELKNAEDRYIVQQLTRYYEALREEKPLQDEFDYRQPIELIVITPNFHRDNFTDRKYSHLSIQFLGFEILVTGKDLYLELKDLDNSKVSKIEIPHQLREGNQDIPAPPRAFVNRIAKCSTEQQEEITKIRQKILGCDNRMQEMSFASSIKYGNGNSKASKFCAEFYFDSKGVPIIFLWLGLKNNRSERIGRARIWTDWQGNALLEGYVPSGIGDKITLYKKTLAKKIEKLNKLSNEPVQTTGFKYFRQHCKDINKVIRKLNNHELILYEEYKLLEVDLTGYAIGSKGYVVFDFGEYEALDGFVELA
ncbi:hypothetical protein NIES4074_21060 [Cylindrospermum sp. NIES-4074]|nr:hypothetical protein NIES4074_21060 [Cylindrospermum sp. NIES-4074]